MYQQLLVKLIFYIIELSTLNERDNHLLLYSSIRFVIFFMSTQVRVKCCILERL